MDGEVARFFKKTGNLLVKARILTHLDKPLFVELCHLHADLQKLRRELRLNGFVIPDERGSFKRNPATLTYKDLLVQYLRICQKFGLSPSDREKLDLKVDDNTQDAIRKDIFGE
jgi:P27 family predicted phage terminase small subunit